MNVLGFDTSTPATSACVVRADGEAFEARPEVVALAARPGHARELLPAIDRVMGAAGLGFGDLDALAPGVGPGTFTGLRIGIATARALARATGVPVRPVSSLAALAAGVEEAAPGRLVLALIDARRRELFAALYEDGRERWAPFVDAAAAIVARLQDEVDDPARCLAAGDGSLQSRAALEAVGVEVAEDTSPVHVVRALYLCRLARSAAAVAPDAVVPHYLRAPDAKPSP